MKQFLSHCFWYLTWKIPSTSNVLDPRVFCLCFRIHSKKSKSHQNLNIRFDRKSKLYCISEARSGLFPLKVFFHSHLRSRAWNYIDGISTRAKILANIYGLENIDSFEIDGLIDCGANCGDLLQYLVMTGNKVPYYGYEPGVYEYHSLLETIRYYKAVIPFQPFQLFNVALGSSNKSSTLYYEPTTADSSLIRPSIGSVLTPVKEVTIDHLFSQELSGSKDILLKLEAEGCEPEVIEGAAKSLSYIKYIAVDMGPERGIKKECTVVNIVNLLYANSYIMDLFCYPPRITALFKRS